MMAALPTCTVSELDDLDAVARCHARAFPRAMATLQGHRFTRKMLEWYVVAERGTLFHIALGGSVIGYCGGIRTHQPGLPGAFTSISQYAFWAFVRSYLTRPWLLLHPENLTKRKGIIRNLSIRMGLHSPTNTVDPAVERAFRSKWGLVVIGVDPRYHGAGYGAAMLQEFERLAREDGAQWLELSVSSWNQKAIASYERNGWSVARRNGDSLVMTKDLDG